MAHTALLQRLLTAAAMTEETERLNLSVTKLIPETETKQPLNRRAFLGQAGMALGGGLTALLPRPLPAATAPRIAIIGGGVAGLSCAYRLRKAGLVAQVYEAADRLGGRCRTLRGAFADGQIIEQGGELIDDGHDAIIGLVRELGLRFDNLKTAVPKGAEPCFHFDGVPYTYAAASRDIKAVAGKIYRDLRQAGYPTLHNRCTRRGRELDEMSIADWIAESVPGGGQSRLGRLLDVAYNIEYGAETRAQSALNLLYLMGGAPQSPLRLFGKSNEKYHIRGGNDLLVTRLLKRLPQQIQLGHALTAIKRNRAGGYDLAFQTAGGLRSVPADHVVMALPFTVLRDGVDFSQAGFSALKQTAIRELAMGTNAKMHVQFRCRHWHELGLDGESYGDTGYQCTWEATRAQGGAAGVLVNETGGTYGLSLNQGTPQERAHLFLQQIEPVMPGLARHYNGKVQLDYWPGDRWVRGSYSYWAVGQYTRFAGSEGQREGRCHFAGEHTSIDSQGYLNGAVETGQRAAREMLAMMRKRGRA